MPIRRLARNCVLVAPEIDFGDALEESGIVARALVLAMVGLLLLAAPAAAVPGTAITDLGTNFSPVDVNASDAVLGTSTNFPGPPLIRVWRNGTLTTLPPTPTPYDLETTPVGVADDGTVVVGAGRNAGGVIRYGTFLYAPPAYDAPVQVPSPWLSLRPLVVSPKGTIVGAFSNCCGTGNDSNGSWKRLPGEVPLAIENVPCPKPSSKCRSTAFGVSTSDSVAGESFSSDQGPPPVSMQRYWIDLVDNQPGYIWDRLNAKGGRTGRLMTGNTSKPVLRVGANDVDLPSAGLDINDAGEAVGSSWDWDGTQFTTLTDHVAGWQLSARALNEAGTIVGVGTFEGASHGFLLGTPCPLPAARGRRAAASCPIVVTRTTDEVDAKDDGACDADLAAAGAQCTLRAALTEANRRTTATTSITFAVPGGASPTITVASALPDVTASVDILGASQPGGGPVRIVSASGGAYPGMSLLGSDSTLSDLVIGGFGSDGVRLGGQGGHKILRSYIGTDPSRCGDRAGAACPLSNAGAGVRITSPSNRVGGSRLVREPFTDQDVVANNRGAGIAITAGDRNEVAFNQIHDNGGLSIDLGDDGPSANDPKDADGGPNGMLNTPVVTSALESGKGALNHATNTLAVTPAVKLKGTFAISPLLAAHGQNAYTVIPYIDPGGCTSFYGAEAVDHVVDDSDPPRTQFIGFVSYEPNGSGTIYDFPYAPKGAAIVVVGIDDAGNTSELSNCFIDRDEDGINDHWETSGVDLERDGVVDVDLKAMGASPDHKDVFVELDWMEGHEFANAGLDDVRAAFAAAPVENPDGTTGINLHLDNGADQIMDTKSGRTWGNLSQANQLARIDHTGSSKKTEGDYPSSYDWRDFDTISGANLDARRRGVFHYAVAAARIRTPLDEKLGAVLGISREIPGRDFLLGLQPTCPTATPCAGLPSLQAAAFMHELGHNLGLTHGGVSARFQHLNFKPNFFSLMNYLYVPESFGREGLSRIFDYSRIGTATSPGVNGWTGELNEKAIVEKDGFAARGRAIDSQGTWVCPLEAGKRAEVQSVSRLSGGMDFNCDGKVSDTPQTIDLTVDRDKDRNPKPEFTLLEGASEWDKIDLRGGVSGLLSAAETTVPAEAGAGEDLPLPTLKEIARAKLGDKRSPKLAIKRLKRRRVRVTGTDDRRAAALEITVDTQVIRTVAPEKRKTVRKLSRTLKLKKGKHLIRAVVYDAAYGSAGRTLKLRAK